ncbi:alpha/beta fold hydrolase [Trujillonella humicola]|uniref:alpha/beta fold hydrolase n=1 Tax=Trujillonella humicola TaxID=3383699 RepID=UPI0039058D91
MSDLAVETWGTGTPVLLVHGSLSSGADEWEAQRPLADEGFRLLVLDRRGYGDSPPAEGEDFLRDADDLCALLDELGDAGPAHLVGHSYGGLSAMVAASRRPDTVRSLVVLEPPATGLAQHDPAARTLVDGMRRLWDTDLPDAEWIERFLRTVGSDPADLPPGVLEAALPLVPLLRRSRPPWTADLPLAELAAAGCARLVVSGGHSPAFDAMCDDLAERVGAARAEVAGAGHEIQFAPGINQVLLQFWRGPAAAP